jgi:hypothetical protein
VWIYSRKKVHSFSTPFTVCRGGEVRGFSVLTRGLSHCPSCPCCTWRTGGQVLEGGVLRTDPLYQPPASGLGIIVIPATLFVFILPGPWTWCGVLKVHLHEIFYFCLFSSSKSPTCSPDSSPKFVLNIKSNSPMRCVLYLPCR